MYFWRISYFVTSSTLRKRVLAGKAFSGMTNGQCMHAAYAQRAFTTSTVLLACHRCLFFSLNRKDRESSAPQVTRQLKYKMRQLKNSSKTQKFEFSRQKSKFNFVKDSDIWIFTLKFAGLRSFINNNYNARNEALEFLDKKRWFAPVCERRWSEAI